jgi:hypothetical protein
MTDLARLYEAFVPGYRDGFPMSADGLPLLTPELLDEVRKEVINDPQGALDRARRAFKADLTFDELERWIDHMQRVFDDPAGAISDASARGGPPVPSDFRFPGMETSGLYGGSPDDTQFEDGDWTGYGLNVATAVVKRFFGGGAAFRWHDDHDSRFTYQLPQNASIALFSDFGTGKPHSWHIAKFIAQAAPDAAIHLGDVYYAGRPAEASAFYTAPLATLTRNHELWSIPGNHDYFSGGTPYFAGIDARRTDNLGGRLHRQEGSYFCLDSTAFRIIGIDGEYHSRTRYENTRLKAWLSEHIAAGKTGNKQVILLSSDEPYSHDATEPERLLHDITANLPPNAIDLWMWGNTHYCALFEPSTSLRPKFYGSCIGHGGYPYKRLNPVASPDRVARILWAETEPRFPQWTGVRQDLGNNGFVMMKLDDANHALTLSYHDWTNALRLSVSMSATDHKLAITSLVPHPRPACRG